MEKSKFEKMGAVKITEMDVTKYAREENAERNMDNQIGLDTANVRPYQPQNRNPIIRDAITEALTMGKNKKSFNDLTQEEKAEAIRKYESGSQ